MITDNQHLTILNCKTHFHLFCVLLLMKWNLNKYKMPQNNLNLQLTLWTQKRDMTHLDISF